MVVSSIADKSGWRTRHLPVRRQGGVRTRAMIPAKVAGYVIRESEGVINQSPETNGN